MALHPVDIQLIGNIVAIRWSDDREDFYPMDQLRAASPSAETQGEPDIFGRIHGKDPRTDYSKVTATAWEQIGNYAIRFTFSDKHSSGLYSYSYLRNLSDQLNPN